ncbi:hypothetical protein [Geodermatophilus sp. URMC 65]
MTATLDQGAAIVAIVTGLNLNVLKASWRDLQVLLGDASKERARLLKAQTEPEVLARIEDLSAELGGSLARSGPPGWLQWAAAMRNSLNHRGDRVTLTYFWRPPRDALRVALLLPRRPEVTDAWAWSRAQEPEELYLQEHASETMSGVLDSLTRFTAECCDPLGETWENRRAFGQLWPQPASQWVPLTGLSSFGGFAVGHLPRMTGEVAVSPSSARRLKAAKSLDADRHMWAAEVEY